jgi:U3 small nucleolar RNA-associated protein 20
LKLLVHYDSQVQKSVLNCLYAYNFNYLTPYKEHLNNLLIGKHFRNEIVVFSLDEQYGVLAQEHRSDFLKILMRILYGKFHSNETTHTSSKDTISNKRSTIIQFISSCKENEIKDFLNLIFDVLIKENRENKTFLVDFKSVLPLKKISGILQTMDIILNKLGKQIYAYSHDILGMLCFVSKYTSQLLNAENNQIEIGKMNTVKLIHRLLSVRFKQV